MTKDTFSGDGNYIVSDKVIQEIRTYVHMVISELPEVKIYERGKDMLVDIPNFPFETGRIAIDVRQNENHLGLSNLNLKTAKDIGRIATGAKK